MRRLFVWVFELHFFEIRLFDWLIPATQHDNKTHLIKEMKCVKSVHNANIWLGSNNDMPKITTKTSSK